MDGRLETYFSDVFSRFPTPDRPDPLWFLMVDFGEITPPDRADRPVPGSPT